MAMLAGPLPLYQSIAPSRKLRTPGSQRLGRASRENRRPGSWSYVARTARFCCRSVVVLPVK